MASVAGPIGKALEIEAVSEGRDHTSRWRASSRMSLRQGTEWLVRRVEGLFGDRPFEAGGQVAHARLSLDTHWREDADPARRRSWGAGPSGQDAAESCVPPGTNGSTIAASRFSPTASMSATLLDLFRRRFACHRFQAGRELPAADLEFILEAGRLSPSSFGLEHWKFVVLRDADRLRAMQAASFGQAQVGGASALIVILAKLAELAPDADYAQRLLAREYPGEQFAPALENYRAFFANTDVVAWSISQCHIAAANMMTAATAAGVDSCAIGGFLPGEVKRILEVREGAYEVALVLALGYCDEAAPSKQRLPLAELVDYR